MQHIELSAFPFAAFTFVFVPLLSILLLNEAPSVGIFFGVVLIIGGIALSLLF